MKKRWILITCLLLVVIFIGLLSAIYIPQRKQALYEKQVENYFNLRGNKQNDANHLAETVTVVELLANPEKYYGKLVCVMGVGWVENYPGDQTNRLYLTKDDCKFHTWNHVSLEWGPRAMSKTDAEAYNGRYVIVEGFFEEMPEGYPGRITRISRYDLTYYEEKSDAQQQQEDTSVLTN